MYPNAVILEVRGLLEEGSLSHRAIASQLGVSRGVVDNIAAGRRGLRCHGDARPRNSREHALGTPSRCPHCGGLVYGACLLCQARSHQRKAGLARLAGGAAPRRRRRGRRHVA